MLGSKKLRATYLKDAVTGRRRLTENEEFPLVPDKKRTGSAQLTVSAGGAEFSLPGVATWLVSSGDDGVIGASRGSAVLPGRTMPCGSSDVVSIASSPAATAETSIATLFAGSGACEVLASSWRPFVKRSCIAASSRSCRCPLGCIVADVLISMSSKVCGGGGDDEAMAGCVWCCDSAGDCGFEKGGDDGGCWPKRMGGCG